MDEQVDGFVFVTHEDAGLAQSEPGYLGEIDNFLDSIADDLWPVNKKIHDNPELGYEEFIAHETLTKFMASRPGWKVTPSAYGMATAWVAVFDSGKKGPVVSFNVEMDALDGIGHACGHNLIATASVAGGLATAEMMKQHGLGGKVVMFGTPAEEGGGGKIKLLEAGAYRDHNVDVNLISHPGVVNDTAIMRTAAYTAFKVEYFGREAHAAASPWLGINALDALITAYNALSVLRQQNMPGDVIQGNISSGGVRPNVIHAYTAGNFVARANTQERLKELKKKVDACFEAGATATGATLKMTFVQSYADHVPNRILGHSYRKYFNALSPPQPIPGNDDMDEIGGRTMASTDQGDISYAMPSLNAGFAIPPGPGGNGPHNPEFAEAAGTRVAFDRCLRVGKALAGTAVDILTEDGLLAEVKKEWEKDVERN
ncbi:hypothetical protein F4818DRAFT_433582 [Hypoxylon cercidicola]|nr:hypothetical protein F4818DRAFT_433582 [Hypoxylon cercidicola]